MAPHAVLQYGRDPGRSSPVVVPSGLSQLGVDQLVADETSGDDVVAERALEVADRAVHEQLRVGRIVERVGIDAAGCLLLIEVRSCSRRDRQRERRETSRRWPCVGAPRRESR